MIEGIFYESKAFNIGTMSTAKITASDNVLHYWVKEKDDGDIDLFFLKPDGVHTSMIMETIERDEFDRRFKDCSTHVCSFRKKTPEETKAEKVEEKVRIGNDHLEKKEFHSAKFEFGNALKADSKNLDANLGKGQAHMALGETEEAKEHFNKMSQNEELFDEDHKHTFNDLGIELRKSGMYEEAIENYKKALSISPKDQKLYYNIARAYKSKGEKDEALKMIKYALEIKPDFREASDFLKACE